ncbi:MULTISPECIES: class A beta-lactamase [unclassified Rhodococcus (in: high G+C Gram-positive bacteria)]|uniref:class A beta-lactamase n=1 Tax=unclassified Rhodococcus (in: high G+C Gram-positive bacteria) TaxID=192944 RepID=UPI001639717F|nr:MULTISPECIES: class A beta-lactamase [unclassified Rhodococcus (in: high G+C Gram-positive bacteria)]MBC2638044.1 class A beta-lactamase [Rhodococcus sp. 3A]MBC2897209.1 class A beta-lactamase [Rhodococcus sp. 4CII]
MLTHRNHPKRRRIGRRGFSALALALPVLAGACTATAEQAPPTTSAATAPDVQSLDAKIDALEARYSTRIGVAAVNTATGEVYSHRGEERFAMCSTFKAYASAAVLRKVEDGTISLDDTVVVEPGDLVENSPVTAAAVGTPMTLGQIAEAALTQSDNTAGNYLLREVGGPQAITALARDVGDESTRLDRWETELNTAFRGDPRDTTTPNGLAQGVRALLLRDVLDAASRDQLLDWMRSSKTSDKRMRAGLPPGWSAADKTGGGGFGTANDAGVVWSPEGDPIALTILTDSLTDQEDAQGNNQAIADSTAAVIDGLTAP